MGGLGGKFTLGILLIEHGLNEAVAVGNHAVGVGSGDHEIAPRVGQRQFGGLLFGGEPVVVVAAELQLQAEAGDHQDSHCQCDKERLKKHWRPP
jgi:hypothetical protein